ncbi:MAG: hypothetical protein CMP57_03455 [Flavobacteriales bacterium]|nr:hypothetical protein [Flavobacteriales bacterium]|tara:strand:- start:1279 stop:3963 length:2685 start_codon:yes stop_codon:yes gene_type:complete
MNGLNSRLFFQNEKDKYLKYMFVIKLKDHMSRILCLIILAIAFSSCQKEDREKNTALEAIPIDAALILETTDLSKSLMKLSKNNLWNLLAKETSIGNSQNTLLSIDSILSPFVSKFSSINPVFLSIHSTGALSCNWMAMSSTKDQEQKLQILEMGLNSFGSIKSYPYSNAKVVEVFIEKKQFFYTIHKGVLMLSPAKVLVEDAIRQLKTKNNLNSDASFQKLYQSSNKKEDFNLYLECKNFDKISNIFLKKNSLLDNHASWVQWGIDLTNEGLLLSGLTISHDSLAQELLFFEGNKGQYLKTPGVLPENTAFFCSSSFENFKQYQRKKIRALELVHQKNNYESNLKGLDINLKEELVNWIGSEISYFISENGNKTSSGITIDLKQSIQVEEYLSSYSDSIFDYRSESIFRWESLKYFANIGNYKNMNDLKFACILGEQLILSKDLGMLKNLINDFKSENSLVHSLDFQNCMKELDSQSNLTFYLQNPEASKWALKHLKGYAAKFINHNMDALKPIRSFALQFNLYEKDCYSNAYLHFDSTEKNEAKNIWIVQLESPLLSEINLVMNHYTKKWEIAVQDELLNIYLISTEGEIIWKRKLEEEILSKIKQIDLYNNQKLQMIFNTKNKVFLIDREGHDVINFPISLEKATQLPLALFDYEKDKNYRILVSSENRHFMYNKFGEKIKGWKLSHTSSPAIHPAEHYVIGGRDYIIMPEQNGTLHILNRKGEMRIELSEKIEFSQNTVQVIQGTTKENSRMITIDKNGTQKNILFDGSIDKSLEFSFKKNTHYEFSKGHNIRTEGNYLSVSGPKINILRSFEESELLAAKIFDISNNLYLCITDKKNSKVYLFRETNEMVKGFPIYGTTLGILEDLNNNGKVNLISSGESGTIFNYSVD